MIACNTATALALPEITTAVPVPVVGVIEPGARAARAAVALHDGGSPDILLLATEATVHSHAYRDRCAALGLRTTEKACPLLVPLVEEGWTDHPVTREVLRIYLREALATCDPQAVLLGCTHYPLLCGPISHILRELGSDVTVIDSAAATAQAVAATLHVPAGNSAIDATFQCFATDSVDKFRRLGSLFLGQTIPRVDLIDLGG